MPWYRATGYVKLPFHGFLKPEDMIELNAVHGSRYVAEGKLSLVPDADEKMTRRMVLTHGSIRQTVVKR